MQVQEENSEKENIESRIVHKKAVINVLRISYATTIRSICEVMYLQLWLMFPQLMSSQSKIVMYALKHHEQESVEGQI